MNDAELDAKDGTKTFAKEPNRVIRCAQGAGVMEGEVMELLKQHKRFAQVIFLVNPYTNYSSHLKCQYCPDQKTTREVLDIHEVNVHGIPKLLC